ncbi:efflux transporter outer membrane subunit [Methylosarcina fibrata]|uniref:efflux transporter outer membrane subunit n=1 Tax=Methylosarcina fibrata TaxID=105972 RepID=UPI00036BF867
MQSDLKRFPVVLLCALSTACQSLVEHGRHRDAPPAPEQWAAATPSDAVQNHWLEDFADPLLAATVQSALSNNFDLKAASARIEAARAEMRIAGAGRWPQLALAAGYRRGDPGELDEETGAFEALFNLSWELDVWGRIRAQQEAAGQEAEATLADWQAARLSLAARTAQNYVELAEAREQVKVAEQSMRDRGTLVELLRGRFRRGLTHALDLRLALTDLANAEAQLAEQRNRVQILTRSLEVLLGGYPEGRFKNAETLPPLPHGVPAGLPSELLDRRPDLNAAFARLSAFDNRLESARKALLPRFTLTANGGSISSSLTDWADPRAAAWNFALGLLQPIFTGGRLLGDIDLQQARVEEALNGYKAAALNAFREVEQSLTAEGRLREQEQALREAVRQTDASRKLAVYSYQHGLIEILTLLDSYRSTLNAQSAHLTARRQLLNNRIELYLALGGGF